MKTVIVGGYSDALSIIATEYNALSGGAAWTATQTNVYQPIPTAGTISKLKVKLSAAVTGSYPFVFDLMVNGAVCSPRVTCSVAVGQTQGSDDTNTVTVAAGDLVSIRSLYTAGQMPTGAPGASWSVIFEGTVSTESIILGNGYRSTSTTYYAGLMHSGVAALPTTNAFGNRSRMPTAGTLSKLYARMSISDSDNLTFTVYNNGSVTTLSAVVANGACTPDTTDTVTLADNEYVQMRVIESGTIAACYVGWGMVFVPTTAGEFIILHNTSDDPATNEFNGLITVIPTSAWTATELTNVKLGNAFTAKKIRVAIAAAPAGTSTRTFCLRKYGSADTALTVDLGPAETSDYTATDVTISDWDRLILKHTVTSTPVATGGTQIGIVGVITGALYLGGSYQASADSGANWTPNTSNDFMFEVWAAGTSGTPALSPGLVKIYPSGLSTGETMGYPNLPGGTNDILPSGIASAGAFGTLKTTIFVPLTGIASVGAFGTLTALRGELYIMPSGIATAESLGSPFLLPGTVSIRPSGIVSSEVFGTHRLLPGLVYILPTGIVSTEAFGTAYFHASAGVLLSGIPSTEALGTVVVLPGGVVIIPDAIDTGEMFGLPVLAPPVSLGLTGITSEEAFGNLTTMLYVLPGGIETSETFGTPLFGKTVSPGGIASSEAMGTLAMVPGKVYILPTGIITAESLGVPIVAKGQSYILPSGIVTAEALGALTILKGIRSVIPTGITTAEAFGTLSLSPGGVYVFPTGIATAESFGTLNAHRDTWYVRPSGLVTAETFGSPNLITVITPTGIASLESFGDSLLRTSVYILPTGIATAEEIGMAIIFIRGVGVQYIVFVTKQYPYLFATRKYSYLKKVNQQNYDMRVRTR